MDKRHFALLVKGIRAVKRHAAGLPVRGARVRELTAPEPVRPSQVGTPAKGAKRS